jgi:hypothetical protein
MLVSRTVAALASVFLLAPLAAAQGARVVKGSHADLKGVTKVYIDTGADVVLRELVEAELREQLPELVLVDDLAHDVVVVQFSRGYVEHKEPSPATDFGTPTRQTDERFQPRVRGSLQRSARSNSPQTSKNSTELENLKSGRQVLLDWYAFGTVLKPAGEDVVVQVVSFRKLVHRGKFAGPAKDFVGKLAKEFRKANK